MNLPVVVEPVLVVEVRRADGSVAERYFGPSEAQLKYEHDMGRCNSFCGYCYKAVCDILNTIKK